MEPDHGKTVATLRFCVQKIFVMVLLSGIRFYFLYDFFLSKSSRKFDVITIHLKHFDWQP